MVNILEFLVDIALKSLFVGTVVSFLASLTPPPPCIFWTQFFPSYFSEYLPKVHKVHTIPPNLTFITCKSDLSFSQLNHSLYRGHQRRSLGKRFFNRTSIFTFTHFPIHLQSEIVVIVYWSDNAVCIRSDVGWEVKSVRIVLLLKLYYRRPGDNFLLSRLEL